MRCLLVLLLLLSCRTVPGLRLPQWHTDLLLAVNLARYPRMQAGYQHGMAAAQQAQRVLHSSPKLAAGPSEGGAQ